MPDSEGRTDYRIPFVCGMLLFLFAITWDVEAEILRYLLIAVMIGGLTMMGWGLSMRFREQRVADERFLVNRLKASRFALVVGLAGMGGLMAYDWVVHRQLQMELVAVIALMAVAKGAAMLYFHRT